MAEATERRVARERALMAAEVKELAGKLLGDARLQAEAQASVWRRRRRPA